MKRRFISILVIFIVLSLNNFLINCDTNTFKSESTPLLEKAQKKTSTWDFFQKTSKDNQNMAEKALGIFVLGIICFIISIYLTCWNERRAVKEVEFTDFISKESKCISVGNGVKVDKVEPDMSYIVSGTLELDKQAEIPNLDLEFKYGGGRIFIISYEVEKYSIHTYTNSENEQKTVKEWVYNYESNVDEKFKSRIITGEGSINGVYKVNLEKLSYLVEKNQTKSLADNKYKHIFSSNDSDIMTKYFNTDSNGEIKVFLKDDYAYVIRKDADKATNFSEKDYPFSEDDRRISIKYVSYIDLLVLCTTNISSNSSRSIRINSR